MVEIIGQAKPLNRKIWVVCMVTNQHSLFMALKGPAELMWVEEMTDAFWFARRVDAVRGMNLVTIPAALTFNIQVLDYFVDEAALELADARAD